MHQLQCAGCFPQKSRCLIDQFCCALTNPVDWILGYVGTDLYFCFFVVSASERTPASVPRPQGTTHPP